MKFILLFLIIALLHSVNCYHIEDVVENIILGDEINSLQGDEKNKCIFDDDEIQTIYNSTKRIYGCDKVLIDGPINAYITHTKTTSDGHYEKCLVIRHKLSDEVTMCQDGGMKLNSRDMPEINRDECKVWKMESAVIYEAKDYNLTIILLQKGKIIVDIQQQHSNFEGLCLVQSLTPENVDKYTRECPSECIAHVKKGINNIIIYHMVEPFIDLKAFNEILHKHVCTAIYANNKDFNQTACGIIDEIALKSPHTDSDYYETLKKLSNHYYACDGIIDYSQWNNKPSALAVIEDTKIITTTLQPTTKILQEKIHLEETDHKNYTNYATYGYSLIAIVVVLSIILCIFKRHNSNKAQKGNSTEMTHRHHLDVNEEVQSMNICGASVSRFIDVD